MRQARSLPRQTRELTETEGVTTRAAELHRSALLARDRAARRCRTGRGPTRAGGRSRRGARSTAAIGEDGSEESHRQTQCASRERDEPQGARRSGGRATMKRAAGSQAAAAALAARDQAAAVANERLAALRRTRADWRSRSGENVRRLSDMNRRLSELQAERERLATTPRGTSPVDRRGPGPAGARRGRAWHGQNGCRAG